MQKIKNFFQQNKIDTILFLVIMGICLYGILWNLPNFHPYINYNNSTIDYDRGVVLEVLEENLVPEAYSPDRYDGSQLLQVKMKEGEFKDEIINVTNYLSSSHNINAHKNSSIIICVDAPTNTDPYFSVYNYDRTNLLYLLIGLFLLLLVIVGQSKGFKSAVTLVFAIIMIITYLLPAIYNGVSPIPGSILVALVIAGFSLCYIHGFNKKTVVIVASVASGVLLSGLTFSLLSWALNLSGFLMEEGEELIVVAQNTGLKLQDLIFTAVIISSLGAVMDVGISIASSLFEISQLKQDLTPSALYHHGMNIGKDIIGSMCNTLILAFAGGAIATLLVLISYGTSYHQLMSSDYIAIEIAIGLASSAGIVLTIPFAAFLSSLLFQKKI